MPTTVRKKEEAIRRKRFFLVCRCVLVIATCTVGLLQTTTTSPVAVLVVITLSLFSNLYVATMDPFSFFDSRVQSILLIVDSAMIFIILVVAKGDLSFFLPFFFVLLLTAWIEKPILLALASFALAVVSILFSAASAGITGAVVSRVSFMLSAAAYYWYSVLPERQEPPGGRPVTSGYEYGIDSQAQPPSAGDSGSQY